MKVQSYRNVGRIDLIPNTWLRDQERNQNGLAGISAGYPGYGLLYYAVLCRLKAESHNVILEIGTNYGASSIVMAQALIDAGHPGRIHTIELSAENAAIAARNFISAGVNEYIDMTVGDSKQVLKNWDKPLIDIAFIDGSHEAKDVEDDFMLVYMILKQGGLVIFDNTTMGGVHTALKQIVGKYKRQLPFYFGSVVEFPFVSWDPPGMVFWSEGLL